MVEDGKAIGVELKNGEQLFADIVISNLDKPATFNRLLADHPLDEAPQKKIDDFEHRGAFVHMLFKLEGLPDYNEHLHKLNSIPGARFGGAMVIDPEEMQECYESLQEGAAPAQGAAGFPDPHRNGQHARSRRATTSRAPTVSTSPAIRTSRYAASCATRWAK